MIVNIIEGKEFIMNNNVSIVNYRKIDAFEVVCPRCKNTIVYFYEPNGISLKCNVCGKLISSEKLVEMDYDRCKVCIFNDEYTIEDEEFGDSIHYNQCRRNDRTEVWQMRKCPLRNIEIVTRSYVKI
jgi:ribosomal protein S27E